MSWCHPQPDSVRSGPLHDQPHDSVSGNNRAPSSAASRRPRSTRAVNHLISAHALAFIRARVSCIGSCLVSKSEAAPDAATARPRHERQSDGDPPLAPGPRRRSLPARQREVIALAVKAGVRIHTRIRSAGLRPGGAGRGRLRSAAVRCRWWRRGRRSRSAAGWGRVGRSRRARKRRPDQAHG